MLMEKIGHHTGNFYHLRQSFTFYDSNDKQLALSTDSITGLVTDYKHGYYKIPKSGDDNYFSTLDIKIRNNLPQSTYSILFYLYGYRNNSIMSGVDLGPILFGVDGTNYNILKYDDDDSTETRNHTKGIIWFTSDGSASAQSGYNGSIELGLRFFDKSITHFVILSRCVEGKVNLGFSSNIFNVSSTVGNVTSPLYFEDININRRKIKNHGVPTDDGDVTNKKYVDTENTRQDIAINDKADKKYVDLYSGLYGNEFYHLRSEFTVFDHNIVFQQIQSSNIQGLLTDYNLGYYKLPPTSTHGNIRDCEFILSNYDLKVGAYTILLFMYAYENGTKLTGQELGPTISSATSSNLSILRYADDNSINTVDHTKGVIWLNATGQGSVKVKISYFNSLTHFVFLHRCVQGKVGVGFINDVFNVKYVDDAVLFFEKINMNNLEITNISNPTGPKQALTLGYGDDRYIRTDGANAMKNDFRMGGKRIVGLDDPINDSQAATKKYVDAENTKQDTTISALQTGKVDQSYADDNFLNLDGSKSMGGNLNMTDSRGDKHSIIGLKDPQQSDSSYAASVNFVNNTVDDKIKESEDRSLMSYYKENVFLKVMDDNEFKEDDDDITNLGIVNRDFHRVNKKTYHSQIDYDPDDGYYSTRVGISVVYLPLGYYILAYEMYFSDKIDHNQVTIGAASGTLQILSTNTKKNTDHTRTVINFRKYEIHPSDDNVEVDMSLKNKDGESYDAKTDIYVVVYGVEGLGNEVDPNIWDRYFYVDDKKIHFEAPIDMVDKDIENVNNLSINNELTMNNRQIKNLGDGNENSDAVNVKQLNEMETNVTKYVTDEFGKVNPVLSNNSDLIKFIYRNLIRNDSKSLLIKELYFPDSIEGRTQNNYTYQTNGDNKGDVTFYLTFIHKATTSDSVIIALHWEAGRPIYIFVSKSSVVASENLLINEPSLKSYNIPSYYIGKQVYLWITIQNDLIQINFSGSRAISVTHPFIFHKDANLRRIDVSDSPFTIQRGLITKNIYDVNSDAYKDVREYEISEGTFVSAV